MSRIFIALTLVIGLGAGLAISNLLGTAHAVTDQASEYRKNRQMERLISATEKQADALTKQVRELDRIADTLNDIKREMK